jgi:predicted membrane protein
MLEFLQGLFTLTGAAIGVIVAVIIWRYRRLD